MCVCLREIEIFDSCLWMELLYLYKLSKELVILSNKRGEGRKVCGVRNK